VDVCDFGIVKETIDDLFGIAVFDEFRIHLAILLCVSSQEQRQLAEFIGIAGQDFLLRPAIAFVDIDRAGFGKHPFLLKWSVLEQ